MPEKEFNLIDEAWVRLMKPDGRIEEASLADALLRAHEFADLGGETQTQNIAVLRLLLAVLHTVFSRVDENGEDAPLADGDADTALERWEALWESGRFPEKPITDYFAQWHERFWLFHPERPFMQALSAANGTYNDARKLIGELSESNNKIRLFQMRSGEGKKAVSYAEAARWLLFLNGFDDCAVKPKDKLSEREKVKIAWLGRLGLVYVQGDNLFETLMLNMTLLDYNKEIWGDNEPAWELEKTRTKELQRIPQPNNPAKLLTMQSRLILLQRESGVVTGYTIKGGDAFDIVNAYVEPMTRWKHVSRQNGREEYYEPQIHIAEKQMWRDFSNIFISSAKNFIPGVVEWVKMLKEKECLDKHKNVRFVITGLFYDKQQRSTIIDSTGDNLRFSIALFDSQDRADIQNEAWLLRISEEVDKCDQIANAVGKLAQNIYEAGGGNSKDKQMADRKKRAKERWYGLIDEPFRKWLRGLEPGRMTIDTAVSEWLKQESRIAYALGDQLVERAGEQALFGRKVDGKRISAAEALLTYKYKKNGVRDILWGGSGK